MRYVPAFIQQQRPNWLSILSGIGFTVFLLVALSQATDEFTNYPLELFLCFLNGCLSIYGLLLSLRREASVHFVSFLFCFLFMSAAPIVQLGSNLDPIFRIDQLPFWASLNGLVFTVIGIFLTYRMRAPDVQPPPTSRNSPSNINYLLVLLVVLATSGMTIVLFHDSLFTSREAFGQAMYGYFSDVTVDLLAGVFLLSTPFFGAIIGLRSAIANRQKIWIALFCLGTLIAAVVNNPFITARYQLAGLVFFAIDYLFFGRKTNILVIMLVVGVLVAPIFQAFRYSISDDQGPEDKRLFSTTLLSKDYDAFPITCYTVLAVEHDGVAWGSNILGAALFFVPRALWPGKPEPTAWIIYDVASHLDELGTENLSTPLMAEGYFAFGWVGTFLISIGYWWLISATTLRSRRDPDSWSFLVRCVFAGLALIFLRGTLTVGVSAVVGSFIGAAIPAYLMKYRFSGGGLRFQRHRHIKAR